MFHRPIGFRPHPRSLGRWLLVVAAMVFFIVIVGGITRLTESGLSITQWKPIRGIIPPLNAAQWQAEFAGYKAIPQYQALNAHMTLEGFKHIYFWEYVHRLLARTIGMVLGIVLVVYWWRRWIPAGYGRRILLILALGGLQGAIGWWMVASGLQYRTEVSHIRLATHLLAALLIYSVLIWTALDLHMLAENTRSRRARLYLWPAVAIVILALQILLGAFTAGLRAGYAFASWPKMGETWFPAGGWADAHGFVWNVVSNPIVVQFIHRWWAWAVAIAALLLAAAARRAGAHAAPVALVLLVALQILLGITTLLTGVVLEIAVAHQAVAALLLGAMIWAAHRVGRSKPDLA